MKGISMPSRFGSAAKPKLDFAAIGEEADVHFARENYVELTAFLKKRCRPPRSATERALIGEMEQEARRYDERRQQILAQFKAGDVVVPVTHGERGCVRFLSFTKRPPGTAQDFGAGIADDAK